MIKYKRIYFKCYSDFDIPYDSYDKELVVETFKDENFELIINPCFTFFGETLINTISDHEAPLLPEREEPIIEEDEEENPQIISPVAEMTQNQKVDNKNKKNKEENNTNASNANNANTTNEKKFSPNATVTSNLSGKGGDKKDKGKDKEKENINQNQPKEQPKPEQESQIPHFRLWAILCLRFVSANGNRTPAF